MTPPNTSERDSERLWRTALTPRWLAALLALIVLVVAFIVLGRWQWDRTQDILAAERSAAAAPIDLAELVDNQGSWNNADIGRTVNLQGTFTDDELLLANRELDGQAGVWVVTRFELDGGQTVAVVRGWLPDDAFPSPLSRQSVIIQGVLHPDEEFYEGANATRVVTVDSAALAVLLACRRTAKAADKQLVVVGLPQGLQSMAALYGVDGLLTDASSPS